LTVAAGDGFGSGDPPDHFHRAEVKWPNDILIRGKKAAGVLTELSRNWIASITLSLGSGSM